MAAASPLYIYVHYGRALGTYGVGTEGRYSPAG